MQELYRKEYESAPEGDPTKLSAKLNAIKDKANLKLKELNNKYNDYSFVKEDRVRLQLPALN